MDTSKVISIQRYYSPCGDLTLGSYEGKLCLCNWAVNNVHNINWRLQRYLKVCFKEETSDTIQQAAKQLDEYFVGKRKEFDLPLLFVGAEFQQRVWRELLTIPYGRTISYAEQAKRLGCPKSIRVVANANGANALSIFTPCHRVIGSDNSLTGYGGGLPAKKFLLELEANYISIL